MRAIHERVMLFVKRTDSTSLCAADSLSKRKNLNPEFHYYQYNFWSELIDSISPPSGWKHAFGFL